MKMTDETQAPETLTPAPALDPAPVAEPEPDPETEPNVVLDAVDPAGGVWRCLNETCPEFKAGATFLAPTQQAVQMSGEHPVCPGCQNDPAPHYIYVAPAAKNAATAAAA